MVCEKTFLKLMVEFSHYYCCNSGFILEVLLQQRENAFSIIELSILKQHLISQL